MVNSKLRTDSQPFLKQIIFRHALKGFDNLVRKNRYTGIAYGNVSNKFNFTLDEPNRGLHYECNTNVGVTKFDFLVAPQGIRQHQGLALGAFSFSSAGNKFSYAYDPTLDLNADFNNAQFSNYIDYYYDPNGVNEKPNDYSEFTMSTHSIGANDETNECLPAFCEPPCRTDHEVQLLKSDFYNVRKQLGIAKNAYQSTPTAAIRNRILYYQQEMDKDLQLILLHVQIDTANYNLDTVRTWIKNIHSIEGDIWLSAEYFRAGQVNKSNEILDAIPAKFTLSSEQQTEIEDYQNALNTIAGYDVKNLPHEVLADLETYTQTQGPAKSLAKNILTLYGNHFPPEYTLADEIERSDKFHINAKLVENRRLIVFPNPASNSVGFRACLKIYGCTSFQYAESNFVTRPYAPKSVGC